MDSTLIEKYFAEHLTDGKISCSSDELSDIIKSMMSSKTITGTVKPRSKRKLSSFMFYLKEHRTSIKDEYFADYSEYNDWSREGILSYYSSKDLPLEKITVSIEKSESQNKEPKKPRLVALVNTKAGILWGAMTEDEKSKYSEMSNASVPTDDDTDMGESVENTVESIQTSTPKKRGRPAGHKPKNNVLDNTIESTQNEVEEEEIIVEQIEFDGKPYLKNPTNGDVYDPDTSDVVGKFVDGSIVFS